MAMGVTSNNKLSIGCIKREASVLCHGTQPIKMKLLLFLLAA